jgi:uncharacterized FAD-dependent dehydrogenase
MGLMPYDFANLLPEPIITALKEGLANFSCIIKGFEKGIMLGIETKTSAAVQAIRNEDFTSNKEKNIYIIGEGSGHAAGIISSATDGIKAAMTLLQRSEK